MHRTIRMPAEQVRDIAYEILYAAFPDKLTAGEIARRSHGILTRGQVHYALRYNALMNPRFSIFPDPVSGYIRYSVY